MGGSKQTQTTNQQTSGTTSGSATATKNPWEAATPLLGTILDNAQKYGADTSMFTPNYSDASKGAAQSFINLGTNPTAQQGLLPGLISGTQAGFGTGNQALMSTASGGMLGGNPYLDSVLNTATQKAADKVNSQFAGAGRYGSGAHTGVLGDTLGAIETNARMQNYDTERARQLNAAGLLSNQGIQGAGLAGQLDTSNATQAGLLAQGGGMLDTMANTEKQAPIAATNWMAGLGVPIAGLGGTSSQTSEGTQTGTQNGTTTTTTPANTMGMIAGGLQAGLGLMTGNPMMALGGASSLFGGGGSSPSYYQPGTASNGGWSTAAYPASTGWWPFS